MHADTSRNFVVRHWNGHYSLLVTLVVILLLLRLVLGYLQSIVPSVAVVPWIALSIAIMVWQIVGAFRSADHALRSHGTTVLHWCLYAMILLTIVLTVLQASDVLSGRKSVVASAQSVEPLQTTMLPLSDNASTVIVEGEFTWPLRRAFLDTIEATPSVKIVILNSDGGLVYVGRSIALTISNYGLSTHVNERCHSACTIAFIAGKERSIAADARLGFHRYLLQNEHQTHGLSVVEQLETDREHFAKNGVADSFLKRLFDAEHSDIWIPDHQTLIDSGVLTQ